MLQRLTNIILLLCILSIYLVGEHASLYVISNGLIVVFIIAVLFEVLVEKKLPIFDSFSLLFCLFLFVISISYFFSYSQPMLMVEFKGLIYMFLFSYCILNYINTYKRLHYLLNVFIITGVISSIYILINPSRVEFKRYGRILGDQNYVSLILSLAFLFSLYYILFRKKYLYIPFSLFMLSCILLTGSRVGIIFNLVTLVILLFLNYRHSIKSLLKCTIMFIIVVAILSYIVFNVPIFYDALGNRLENLFSFASGKGTDEDSINSRQYFIEFGFELFKEKPLIGYGINNFRLFLIKNIGRDAYSHSNYVELLVGVGVIGLISYYLIYANALRKLYALIKKNNTLSYLLTAMVIATILIGYSWVYYRMKQYYILLACIHGFVNLEFQSGMLGEKNDSAEKEKKCITFN